MHGPIDEEETDHTSELDVNTAGLSRTILDSSTDEPIQPSLLIAQTMQVTYQGSLFSSDFLTESIVRLSDWSGIDDAALDLLAARFREVFARFPTHQSLTQNRKSRPGISRERGVGCGLLRTTRRTGDAEEGTQRGADSAFIAAG